MSELLCVAVPGGVLREGEAVLRLLVVPRLDGLPDDAVLAATAMADWPALLAGAAFTVRTAQSVGGAAQVHQARRLDGEQVSPGLWPRMFPATMPVNSYRPPGTYAAPKVDRSVEHRDTIEGVYRNAAANPGDSFFVDRQLRDAELGAPPAPQLPAPPDAGPRVVPPPDFHRVTTMFREHPAVLRALGLIVELRLPDVPGLGAQGLVSVEVTLPAPAGGALATVSPWTGYLSARGRFVPAPRAESDIALGMLDLSREHWHFSTFDVAGALDRLRDAAQSPSTPDLAASTLPALHSSGLSLMRHDRQAVLEQTTAAAQRGAGRASMAGTVLFADDLVLGYRVDVRTDVGVWLSLMSRSATYLAGDMQPALPAGLVEEGQIKANAATVEHPRQADDPGGQPSLRADEVIARWDGWSLTCPDVITGGPGADPLRLPHLHWDYTPLGLPRLRFGREYRMRVRIADAAGGGLTPEDPDLTEGESREVFYGRHDPVPPPFLVPPAELLDDPAHPRHLGPGGALQTLVIRSNPAAGESVADYSARYPANDQRLLLPPRTTFRLIEEHGRLDAPVTDETAAALLRRATTPETHDLDGAYSWVPDPVAEGVALTLRPATGEPLSAATTAREAWTVPSGAWPDFLAKTVRLDSPTAAGERVIDWTAAGRTALVRVAPGTRLTLALTSTVGNDELDRFAMHNWLTVTPEAQPPDLLDDTMDLVRTGRHPMVSPGNPVEFVHAVKQPVRPPQGQLTADRAPAATVATLTPSDPLLGLHPPSTGQIALTAAWTEVTDGESVPVDEVSVQVVPLGPAASRLPPLHHEFGDTRYRRIAYTVTATSRFRDFFDPEPDAAFQAAELGRIVDVPSTAPPPAPVVRGVYPAFRWTGTELPPGWQDVRRARLGGRLRVELARPWQVSGDDELLGVVLAADPSTARRWITAVRRDPIWPSPLPPLELAPEQLLGTVRDPVTLPLPESGERVMVVPFATRSVAADPAGPGHWFADIEIPDVAAATYAPFVQLALVRYQPHSLAGMHLSPLVRAEPVQLMPDRTLSVQRGGSAVTATLTGLTPSRNQDAELGDHPDDVTHEPQVRAHLEQWTGAGTPTELTATRPDLPHGWQRVASVTGRVGDRLPLLTPPGGGPLRLVVREVERFMQQTEPATTADDITERVVFADVVDLA